MHLLKSFSILLIISLITDAEKEFDETLHIKPNTLRHRSLIEKFTKNNSHLISFENLNSNTVLVSVVPKLSVKLKNYLYDHRIPFLEVRRKATHMTGEPKSHPLAYNKTHMPYKDILKMLIKWRDIGEKDFEDKIELLEIGRTVKNKPIVIAKITEKVSQDHNQTKTSIFIESTIHAREWSSTNTALYIMSEMIFEPYYRDALKKFVFHFLFVMNVDGYIHTWTTNRWWRKNLRPAKKSTCVGVDLNRNFDVHFGQSSNKFCQEDYKGTRSFSEKESQAERDYIKELVVSGGKISLFLAFHSYGQQITYPYGYSPKKIPNWKESHEMLHEVTKNLETYNTIDYHFGQTYFVIYPAAGGSDDWVRHNSLAKYVFVMELRDKGNYGFFLPEDKIEENALDGLVALNTILNRLSPGIVKIKPNKRAG